MKKFWKQLGGWVTELRIKLGVKVPDIFGSARLQIAALYFFSIFLLLPITLLNDRVRSENIKKILNQSLDDPALAEAVALSVTEAYATGTWEIRIIGILALAAIAWVVAGITLRPIRKAFEGQRRFIANASHELRTPLATMKTNAEVSLMKKRELDKEGFVKTVRGSLEEINRMGDTLHHLLTFSGYQSTASKPLFNNLNICEVVERAMKLVAPAAEAKNIKISFSGDIPSVIRGNAVALEEMIVNLLKNSVVYTPEGGSVDIIVERNNGRVSLIVRDTGIGIATEDLPYIFEPFYRGANSLFIRRASGTGSAGLGLTLVKEIAKLHRARVAVESEPQRGTTFLVSFRGG